MPFFPGSGGGGGGGASNTQAFAQTAHGFVVGDEVYISALNTFAKADSDSAVTSEWIGTVSAVADANNFTLRYDGIYVTDKGGLTAGQTYYISGTAGALTATEPSSVSSVSKPIFTALNATSGFYRNFRGSPAQGQTAVVEYVQVSGTTSYTLGANGTAVAPTSPSIVGGIPYSAGVFTLLGGKTYDLEGALAFTAGDIFYQWRDITSNTFLGVSGTVIAAATSRNSTASAIFTPAADTTVRLEVTFGGGSVIDSATDGRRTYLKITQIGAAPVPMTLVGEYGENNGITNGGTYSTTLADIAGSSFSIPTAGTWEVTYNVFQQNTLTDAPLIGIYDTSNVLVPNSVSSPLTPTAGQGGSVSGSNKTYITTTGAATYKLRGQTGGGIATIRNASTIGTGNSKITWRKISGFLPSSGSTVDYVTVKLAVAQSGVGANTAIAWDTVKSGNIPMTAGVFSLSAGNTYRMNMGIRATSFSSGATGSLTAGWYDVTNAVFIGDVSGTGGSVAILPQTDATSESSLGVQEVIYTPTADVTVTVRTGTSATGTMVVGTASWAVITQLGSSAVIAGVYPGNWTTYTPVVTITSGTNPTLPTSASLTGSYSIQGKTMFLNLKYFAATTALGADGSGGSYQYSLPSGFTIDLTKAAVPSVITNTAGSGLDGGNIGSGFGRNTTASNSAGLMVVPLSSTTIGAYFEGGTRLLGPSALAMTGAANTMISMVCQIPLL